MRRQLFHLIRQNLCFLQDRKLWVRSAISTRKNQAEWKQTPNSQRAPATAKVFIPESCARSPRQKRRLLHSPPRHDGSRSWRSTESELVAAEQTRTSRELLLQLCSVTSPPTRASTILSDANLRTSAKPPKRRKQIHTGKRKCLGYFSAVVGIPSSTSRPNSWKSGKVCVRARDSPQWGWKWEAGKQRGVLPAPGSLDQWIRLSGCLHRPPWIKESYQLRN